jgi:hypothetical protein
MKIQGLIDGICEIIRSVNWQAMHRNTLEVDSDAPALVLNFGLFSGNFFTKRLDPDYASRMQDYLMELIGILKGMGSFWQPPEQ